jgi:putative NIF3 family GTP cyclohydrolase 1 type 2
MHAEIFEQLGITISVAEHIMKKRIGEVERSLNGANYNRAVDAARLLNFPFMCMHTVADNCVSKYLTNLFNNEKPYQLKDIIDLLLEIEEYKISASNGVFPKIINGSDSNKTGKIFVDMTGGTDVDKEMLNQYAKAGISTVICMHVKESHLELAKKSSLNLIIAGHIACDVLGLNLLFDEIEKEEKIDFVSVSGFKRIRNNVR